MFLYKKFLENGHLLYAAWTLFSRKNKLRNFLLSSRKFQKLYYILYCTSYIFILQNNDKLSLVVGRRHVHVKRKQSCVNGDEVDEVDGGGNSPIKTNFPAISHSRSRSEPAIQQSDLEITASEIDSEDSSSDDDDEAGI